MAVRFGQRPSTFTNDRPLSTLLPTSISLWYGVLNQAPWLKKTRVFKMVLRIEDLEKPSRTTSQVSESSKKCALTWINVIAVLSRDAYSMTHTIATTQNSLGVLTWALHGTHSRNPSYETKSCLNLAMLWDILVITQMLVLIITTILKMVWITMKHSSLFEIMLNGQNSQLNSGTETIRLWPPIFNGYFEKSNSKARVWITIWFPITVSTILGFIRRESVLDY